jgi:uncharacterized DUF497 family protein
MSFEWDPVKAGANFRKHGIPFSEAEPVFMDDLALTIRDDESDPDEQRFVSIGKGVKERVLVAVFLLWRQKHSHHLGAAGEAHERAQYEEHR